MTIETPNKLNRLLQSEQSGKLYFAAWLKQRGYSDQLLRQYRNSGWLTSISKGVMYRTGGKLLSFGAIASYNEQMNKNFYVGAHSALELSGFNHYVPMGKPLLMVGHPSSETVPDWLKSILFERDLRFFSTNTFTKPQLMEIDHDGFTIKVSVIEQAFLECLFLAPKHYSYMDLYYIMEQLTTLRPNILQMLLENTDNNKVKRIFLYMAQKSGHYWFNLLDRERISLGNGKLQLTKGGTYIPEYRITVPKELYRYE